MACGIWCLNGSDRSIPPTRNGVGPSCVALPAGPWAHVLEFLQQRFPSIAGQVWLDRMARGDVIDSTGLVLTPEAAVQTPYRPHIRLYYYREVPDEPAIPFEAEVLYQDEHLVVVDKPHFLPVVPSGGYLNETVLVRLKRQLGIDSLAPIHRIDRDTAGLVMFSVQPSTRAAYAALFSQRRVRKTYQAIAPAREYLPLPAERRSRIVSAEHFMLQREVDGPVNAVTQLAVLEVHGEWARYQLRPLTGQRHQLRVHMMALGRPILNDGLYPILSPEGSSDYQRPLQLLAQQLAFTDPVTGRAHHFESRRSLNLVCAAALATRSDASAC